jgi:fluoride exporter
MYKILLIALGGAMGTLARYGIQLMLAPGSIRFPYGTMLVNVSGCLAIGFLHAQFMQRPAIRPEYQLAVLVGFLGGYTTFSSFGLETSGLMRNGHYVRAGVYVSMSNLVGIACVLIGVVLGRMRAG